MILKRKPKEKAGGDCPSTPCSAGWFLQQIKVVTSSYNGEYCMQETQIRPIETINFKSGLMTFKYLNHNRRWTKGFVGIGSEIVYYMEGMKTLTDK